MAIALFDLDKTLLARNSAALWLMWELRQGHVRLHQAALATAWLLRYRLGHTDLALPLQRSVAVLRGVPDSLWRSRTQAFYEAWVRPQYRRGGLEALAQHRLAGDRLVLLSSTHHHLAQAVHRDLGFDHVLCTHLEVDGAGLLTGRIAGELCFGAGKLAAAQNLCAHLGASLDACVFYTDSNSDTPVLEAVGRPVAVNPDPALARRARRSGWPILDWGPAVPWPPSGLQVAS
jgi:HAD superfamily hydrolase (TIGR01490 family)